MSEQKTLQDAMPHEFSGYMDVPSYKFRDVPVKKEYDGTRFRWPGVQKNVYFWVELENGYAVGWNENPSKGWSFPLVKIKKVS
jgi:hypothetical protein